MPITKLITGLLGEILMAEGVLDDTLLARDVIPATGDSAFCEGDGQRSHGYDARGQIL